MDIDMETVEIVFAQKLACGEPDIRQRALETLHSWIHEQSTVNPFTDADMMRLCKGLHYVLWMQDKMLLQEELADKISGLLTVFASETERALFIRSIFKSLSKEWHSIDRWRMDKFLMLMRRVLRVLFTHLRSLEWKKETRSLYWNAFKESTISADSSFSDGLKFHFAAIFLDELDNAGGLTKKQVTACIQPFADLLSERRISSYLFDSVLDEIFNSILHQRSEEVVAAQDAEVDGETISESEGIKFDYKALGKMLFDIGKKAETISERRVKLYAAVKKFEVAAAGGDPYHFEAPKPVEVLGNVAMEMAHQRLLDEQQKNKQEKENIRKEKRAARLAAKGIYEPAVESIDSEQFSLKVTKKSRDEMAKEAKAARKGKVTPKKKKFVKKGGATKTIEKSPAVAKSPANKRGKSGGTPKRGGKKSRM